MKLLIVSDTHLFNDIFENINNQFIPITQYHIHCGDSSLTNYDPLLKEYNIVVKGNHDFEDFPVYSIYNNILVTHGHLYNIYFGYNDLIKLCKDNNCNYCIHGHTHIPTIQKLDGITFINPGSTMINRGSYGYGTFIVADYNNNEIHNIKYYNSESLEIINEDILKEGISLLDEIKEVIQKK